MKKKVLVILSLFCLILSSCGKNYALEEGTVSSNNGIICNGMFTASPVEHEGYFDYFCADAVYRSDYFDYLLKNNYTSEIRLVSFDQDCLNYSDISLNLPFSFDGQKISSDSYSDLLDLAGAEGLSLFYYDPFFNEKGLIEGYCTINGIRENKDSFMEYLVYDYKIIWNMDGSVNSVEKNVLSDDQKSSLSMTSYDSGDNAGNILTITDTGIVRSSFDGSYSDTYCDFINSSISDDISYVVYGSETCFSAISHNDDNSISFTVYKRGEEKSVSVTPISLYVSSLSDEVKDQILKFNETSDKYRIGVRNYSDLCRDYTIEYPDFDELNGIALSKLEEDVLSGDIPDIIYENSGLDEVFVSRLSSKGNIISLNDAIKKDIAIKDNKYLANIYDLSGDDEVFAIIPSFSYDTYISASSNESIAGIKTLDDYVNYKSSSETGLVVMDSYTYDDIMRKALAFNGDKWIDASNGSVSFGNDLKSYLELASELPETREEFSELSVTGQIHVNIQLFYTHFTNIVKNYTYAYSMLNDAPVNTGFPTSNGPGRVIHPSGAFMICSDRAASQGCWEFVRTFLTEEYQASLIDSIPVTDSSFNAWIENSSYDATTANDYIIIMNGPISVPEISQEEKDQMTEMIRSCNKYYFCNPEIEEIVLNNAHDYFDGKITVDEAKDNIEKEVKAYLNS